MSDRRRHEIAVGFVRTEAFDDECLAALAWRCLPPAERSRCARIRAAGARRDRLVAHALARAMLAERVSSDPLDLHLERSPLGRPELVASPGAPGVRFSLSHADGIALCAVAAGCGVGADVESLDNVGPDPLRAAAAVCSPREQDALRARRADERAAHLLVLWTVKEAVAKAIGLGCYLPLARIEVAEEADQPLTVHFATQAGERDFPGSLACLRLSPRHSAAIAVLGEPWAALSIRVEERELASAARGLALRRRRPDPLSAAGRGAPTSPSRATPPPLPS